MNSLELKIFSEKTGLSRVEIAKLLDSSIHSVNAWFSGSRNLPKSKSKILKNYNVSIQSIDIEDKEIKKETNIYEDRIHLLEEKVSGLQTNFKMLYEQLLFFTK